jgi:hypothetical protein
MYYDSTTQLYAGFVILEELASIRNLREISQPLESWYIPLDIFKQGI